MGQVSRYLAALSEVDDSIVPIFVEDNKEVVYEISENMLVWPNYGPSLLAFVPGCIVF